jgi:cell wall-associated NlpC family hydrolase
MPIRKCLSTIAAIASLAVLPSTATADRWHGGSDDPQQQQADQNQNWDGQQNQNWDGQSSDPSQGDPQEAPGTWNGTPPVQTPSAPQDQSQGNPWSDIPALPVSKTPTVPGKTAMIRRNGLAAVPTGAPAQVRAIIAAANQIIGKPYKWGGGHGRLFDTGYDCSGSVSYALIRSGLLGYPMVSRTLAHWGVNGAGQYVTIYANKTHVYMEVAGLRLDTSSVGDPAGKSGVRWRPPIGKRFGFAVRHVAGL